MMHELLTHFAAKMRSLYTSAGRNLVFLECDTGDLIKARLQEIEREIVRLKGQVRKSGHWRAWLRPPLMAEVSHASFW
ncbi:MAG TPA: hypothetical protein VIU82_05560 [Bosea sp. (in: a-proteobacteria)]